MLAFGLLDLSWFPYDCSVCAVACVICWLSVCGVEFAMLVALRVNLLVDLVCLRFFLLVWVSLVLLPGFGLCFSVCSVV